MNPADAKKMETQRWRSDQPGQIYGSGPSLNFGRGFWDNEKGREYRGHQGVRTRMSWSSSLSRYVSNCFFPLFHFCSEEQLPHLCFDSVWFFLHRYFRHEK